MEDGVLIHGKQVDDVKLSGTWNDLDDDGNTNGYEPYAKANFGFICEWDY